MGYYDIGDDFAPSTLGFSVSIPASIVPTGKDMPLDDQSSALFSKLLFQALRANATNATVKRAHEDLISARKQENPATLSAANKTYNRVFTQALATHMAQNIPKNASEEVRRSITEKTIAAVKNNFAEQRLAAPPENIDHTITNTLPRAAKNPGVAHKRDLMTQAPTVTTHDAYKRAFLVAAHYMVSNQLPKSANPFTRALVAEKTAAAAAQYFQDKLALDALFPEATKPRTIPIHGLSQAETSQFQQDFNKILKRAAQKPHVKSKHSAMIDALKKNPNSGQEAIAAYETTLMATTGYYMSNRVHLKTETKRQRFLAATAAATREYIAQEIKAATPPPAPKLNGVQRFCMAGKALVQRAAINLINAVRPHMAQSSVPTERFTP